MFHVCFNYVTIKHGTLRMLPIDGQLTNLSSLTMCSNELEQFDEDITVFE